jgi:hypothetical protein
MVPRALPLVVLLVAALASVGARASGPRVVDARVEPEPVRFGERVELVITIEREADVRLSLPGEIPEGPALRRIGAPVRSVTPQPGATLVRETLRVPYLALDYEELKTPELTLAVAGGEPLTVAPVDVTVQHDAAGPRHSDDGPPPDLVDQLAPAQSHALFHVLDARPLVAGGTAAFGGLAYLAFLVLARRRRVLVPTARATAEPPAPDRPAHEIALARLDALLAEELLTRGEVAPFVQRLMDDVLRDYLERRFDVAAGTRTTSELAAGLLTTGAPGLDVPLVRKLLDDADMVKFARAELAADVAHGMAQTTRALIESTREREAAA